MEVLSILIENNKENTDMLKIQGYEKRCGSASYSRPRLRIIPCKKWFWEECGIELGTEKYILS